MRKQSPTDKFDQRGSYEDDYFAGLVIREDRSSRLKRLETVDADARECSESNGWPCWPQR